MSEPSVLLYDGSRRLFRELASRVERRADGLALVPLESETGTAFLDRQFGERPFAILFVEDDRVYAGGTAISKLLERYGAGDAITVVVERLYDVGGDSFGRVVHGAEPADLDGEFTLDGDAKTVLSGTDSVDIDVQDTT
ncbi:MAG: hypothetical protein U5K28_12200 [Halobacteriales archaeon]|nr:hypothetical protein [Halobacteriales archaeon]